MSEIIEPPKDEIRLEVRSLSTEEREELEDFLKAQPEITSVGRRMKVRDSAYPGNEAIGFIVAHYDLIVKVAQAVAPAAATTVVGLIKQWTDNRKARKREQDEKMESVALLDSSGRTIKFVKRPKG